MTSIVEKAKRIPLTRGGWTLVDEADYDEVVRHEWRRDPSPTGITEHASRYATAPERASGAPQRILLHRQLTAPSADVEIDHRNGDGLDNRRSNLRFATKSQNGMNRGKQRNNTTGYKGVGLLHGRFTASIERDQRRYHLGSFDTPEEAAAAYAVAAANLHGEFARTDVAPAGALSAEPPLWLEIVDHASRVGRTRLSYFELARDLLGNTSEEALRTIRSATRSRSDRAARRRHRVARLDPNPVFTLYNGVKGGRGEAASGGLVVHPEAVAVQLQAPNFQRHYDSGTK